MAPRFRTARRLTNDGCQPTLDRSHEAPPAEDLAALSLPETSFLLALLRSTTDRAPTTPSSGLTQAIALWLERRGVIALCDDRDLLFPNVPPARAIYDPIAWRYLWAAAAAPGFLESVRARLDTLTLAPESLASKTVLWQLLADAEVEGYLAHLLRKHGFDPEWCLDARDQGDRWTRGLSLAQMRYVVWASVREGASAFLRSNGDLDDARLAIAQELRRRARWVQSKPHAGFSFLPAPTTRQSVLLTIFLEGIAPIGQHYWLSPPTADSLRHLLERG